jgi:polyhydroxyalkanoate synthase
MIQPGAFLDPLGILPSLLKVHKAWLKEPEKLLELVMDMNSDLTSFDKDGSLTFSADQSYPHWKAGLLNMTRACSKLGSEFQAAYGRWSKEYIRRIEGIEGRERQILSFLANQITHAISPSNYFWTNPVAVEKFLDSNGMSLLTGIGNLLEDLARGDHLIQITDPEALEVGRDLANTPGFVVFRNDLMELIQYSPTTKEVHSVPIVFVQAWINKYYIVDLTAENSMIRYLVGAGFTVFMISWKNPGPDMRNVGFDDYMFRGALAGIEAARDICGVQQVHAVGYCVGGAVLAALMAWLNFGYKGVDSIPIKHWTLLATVVDFSEPGEIGVYLTENSIAFLEELMKKDGYLHPAYLANAVRLLRPEILVWRYFAHNYLQGEKPPKSEFLFWHNDHTRIPASACSFLLNQLYLQNNLVQKDKIILANKPLDLRRIRQPLYAVGAEQDHLSPWKGTFKICSLVNAPIRYTLVREGHVTGFVNPPSPRNRKKFISGDAGGKDLDQWVFSQEEKQGSWWPEWVEWLSGGCGPVVPAPEGHPKYPPLGKAPGRYVMES